MRIERLQLGEYVTDLFKGSNYVFIITYKGLTVAKTGDLRRKLTPLGSRLHVLKNSYIKLGLANNQVAVPANVEFAGDSAVVCGRGDAAAVAKALRDFKKDSEFVTIKGGVLDGHYLAPAQALAIADLPPKEVLYAEIVGSIQAPAARLVRLLEGHIGSIPRLLQAYVAKKETAS